MLQETQNKINNPSGQDTPGGGAEIGSGGLNIGNERCTIAQLPGSAWTVIKEQLERGLAWADDILGRVQDGLDEISDLWERLTPEEKIFIKENPFIAGAFYAAKRHVMGRQAASGLNEEVNGKPWGVDNAADAFRHTLWNATMVLYANKLGNSLEKSLGKAQAFADAHETRVAPGSLSYMMDQYNNRVGREIAAEVLRANPNADEKDLEKAVWKALDSGRLKMIVDGKLVAARR